MNPFALLALAFLAYAVGYHVGTMEGTRACWGDVTSSQVNSTAKGSRAIGGPGHDRK